MTTIDVEFDRAVYSLDCLNAAAYRMIGAATCQIEERETRYVCRLTATEAGADTTALRLQLIELATDELLRERLSAKTEPVRNLILSLAFGALASETSKRS